MPINICHSKLRVILNHLVQMKNKILMSNLVHMLIIDNFKEKMAKTQLQLMRRLMIKQMKNLQQKFKKPSNIGQMPVLRKQQVGDHMLIQTPLNLLQRLELMYQPSTIKAITQTPTNLCIKCNKIQESTLITGMSKLGEPTHGVTDHSPILMRLTEDSIKVLPKAENGRKEIPSIEECHLMLVGLMTTMILTDRIQLMEVTPKHLH